MRKNCTVCLIDCLFNLDLCTIYHLHAEK